MFSDFEEFVLVSKPKIFVHTPFPWAWIAVFGKYVFEKCNGDWKFIGQKIS